MQRKRLWVAGGVGCLLLAGIACYVVFSFLMAVAGAGFATARGVGDIFITPTTNSRGFLEALAEDDLERALTFTYRSLATDTETLRDKLPPRLFNMTSVGDSTYSSFAENGSGQIIYSVTFDDGTTARVRLSMRIESNQWLVTSAVTLSDD